MLGRFLRKIVGREVDKHLQDTGKQVVVHKEVVEQHIHHHNYYSEKKEPPRQSGSNLVDQKQSSGWI